MPDPGTKLMLRRLWMIWAHSCRTTHSVLAHRGIVIFCVPLAPACWQPRPSAISSSQSVTLTDAPYRRCSDLRVDCFSKYCRMSEIVGRGQDKTCQASRSAL